MLPAEPITMTPYLISLEGGGTRSQAVLMDFAGNALQSSQSSDVNTNFVSYRQAEAAVQTAAQTVLQAANVPGEAVTLFVSALVGPDFGRKTFGSLCPNAHYWYYNEQDVVFARAGLYRPHGVALVAATGATAWGVRADDGRKVALGGWGALLGDEGSAYAAGLLALRAVTRVYDGRETTPTRLLEAICQHFDLKLEKFFAEITRLAYKKPLSRAEIGGLAGVVTRLAEEGDPLAGEIICKVTGDLTALALHAARRLFAPAEAFDVAAAGGLFNAGELILAPLRGALAAEFPAARLILGSEAPAVSLGRLALYEIQRCGYVPGQPNPRTARKRRADEENPARN